MILSISSKSKIVKTWSFHLEKVFFAGVTAGCCFDSGICGVATLNIRFFLFFFQRLHLKFEVWTFDIRFQFDYVTFKFFETESLLFR